MDDGEIERIRGLVRDTPGLALALSTILDRKERSGRLPLRLTLKTSSTCASALRALLSARAVAPKGEGQIVLHLGVADRALRVREPAGLDALLYRVLERAPRDPATEEAQLRARLDVELAALSSGCRTEGARSFLASEREETRGGTGESHTLALARGVDEAATEARRLILCIDAAAVNRSSIRLANFSARVLGDSKALLPGSDRLRRLCTALLRHDVFTAAEVAYLGDGAGPKVMQRLVLEVNEIHRDESAVSVLVFGPLAYEKQGQRFDQVARHATFGDPVRLTLGQLRGARLPALDADRVTVIENQTPFLDHVEGLARRGAGRELVVLSEGQASSATVALLKLVSRAAVPIRHAGDLDRSGVLILRSLSRRVGAVITPWGMDVATHRRYAERGRPLDAGEAERLRVLLAGDEAAATGHELLAEIARTGRWIEQEVFFEELQKDG